MLAEIHYVFLSMMQSLMKLTIWQHKFLYLEASLFNLNDDNKYGSAYPTKERLCSRPVSHASLC